MSPDYTREPMGDDESPLGPPWEARISAVTQQPAIRMPDTGDHLTMNDENEYGQSRRSQRSIIFPYQTLLTPCFERLGDSSSSTR